MSQPWIYMCSPVRSPLPPPSPPDPSGSSQCTRPEHLSHASSLGWWSVSPLSLSALHVAIDTISMRWTFPIYSMKMKREEKHKRKLQLEACKFSWSRRVLSWRYLLGSNVYDLMLRGNRKILCIHFHKHNQHLSNVQSNWKSNISDREWVHRRKVSKILGRCSS